MQARWNCMVYLLQGSAHANYALRALVGKMLNTYETSFKAKSLSEQETRKEQIDQFYLKQPDSHEVERTLGRAFKFQAVNACKHDVCHQQSLISCVFYSKVFSVGVNLCS